MTESLKKSGTLDSLVGKVLAKLAEAPTFTRSRAWLANALESDMDRVAGALRNLRMKRFVEMQGTGPDIVWSVTPASIHENAQRQALSASA